MRYPSKAGSATLQITSCYTLSRFSKVCSTALTCVRSWLYDMAKHSKRDEILNPRALANAVRSSLGLDRKALHSTYLAVIVSVGASSSSSNLTCL